MANHTYPIRLMIDFETPSLDTSTAPLTLAAVPFAVPGITIGNNVFYDKASFSSIERRGFTVSKETMEWWDKQDPIMRNEVFNGTQDIESLMQSFIDWCTEKFADDNGSLKHIEIWSRGADFDCVILQEVCMELWGNYPFDFRMHRCQRTLESLLRPEFITSRIPKQENKHHALQDAIYQARVAELALIKLATLSPIIKDNGNAHTNVT